MNDRLAERGMKWHRDGLLLLVDEASGRVIGAATHIMTGWTFAQVSGGSSRDWPHFISEDLLKAHVEAHI